MIPYVCMQACYLTQLLLLLLLLSLCCSVECDHEHWPDSIAGLRSVCPQQLPTMGDLPCEMDIGLTDAQHTCFSTIVCT